MYYNLYQFIYIEQNTISYIFRLVIKYEYTTYIHIYIYIYIYVL